MVKARFCSQASFLFGVSRYSVVFNDGGAISRASTGNIVSGYLFTGWTGSCSGASTTCTLTVIGDTVLGANFKVDPNYDFTVNAPTATATVSRGGTAEYSVVFAPVANDDSALLWLHRIAGWLFLHF